MNVADLIGRHLPGTKCSFIRTGESAVTTSWGVRWNEAQIARDLLQNFYDANRDELQAVSATLNGGDVRIAGPAGFDLERLFYLGSEKTRDDIGQYGEGFKAAAMCLLRDHGVSPVGVSGKMLVHVRLADSFAANTKLRPLIYDFYTIAPDYPGAMLLLPGCSPVLARELQQGMAHFFFDQNPLLAGKIWESWDHHYALYRAHGPDGHIFYRRLRRATISGFPIIPVIHKASGRLDKRIEQDRDRNAFEDTVLDLCYDVFARGIAVNETPILAILEASRRFWEKGHPLLRAVASRRQHNLVTPGTEKLFGDKYYAAANSHDAATRLQYEQVEAPWKIGGRRQLPSYFTRFGVPSAETHLASLRNKALVEEQKKERSVTHAEEAALRVLNRALSDLAPVLARLLASKRVRYSVADTETILGALIQGRGYQSIDVFLAASVFVDDFARALAVFLHEHAHIFGYDGSRGFTDALTELLEGVIRQRGLMDFYERDWDFAREKVREERGATGPEKETNIGERLAVLDRDGLLHLLERVPDAIVRPLLWSDKK